MLRSLIDVVDSPCALIIVRERLEAIGIPGYIYKRSRKGGDGLGNYTLVTGWMQSSLV